MRSAFVLSMVALVLAVLFLVSAIGHRLHAELLAVPIILLAIAQIVGMRSSR